MTAVVVHQNASVSAYQGPRLWAKELGARQGHRKAWVEEQGSKEPGQAEFWYDGWVEGPRKREREDWLP